MSRTRPIRIKKNDVNEHKRLARNARNKINRLKKKFGMDHSNDIKIPKISEFKTRDEYNEWKESIQDFTNRYNTNYQYVKNKHGLAISKKELNEIQRANKDAIRIAKKMRDENISKPYSSGGIVQGTVGQELLKMGKPNTGGIYVPNEFDFDNYRTRKQLDEKAENIKERADPQFVDKRTEQLKENFITALNKEFNSLADPLIEKVKTVDAKDLFELILMHEEMTFQFVYTEEDVINSVAAIDSILTRYENDEIDMDLKGF